ncbi:MAG: ABC transporter substrate-binding protein [Terriglobales bacterium]
MAASLSVAVAAPASTRPRYGGTLRISIREAPTSLDPIDSGQPGISALPSLSRLIFDTLAILDARGQTQPALSSSWQADNGNQRWQFNIRRGVAFHDGTAVSPDAVAAALRAANPSWKVFASGEAVIVECHAPTPNLPAVLALSRNSIAKRSGGKLVGSGPFAITQWDPGKKLVLTARDDYWGGRAFVDSVEIEMGKGFREQMIAMDLGKADIVEVAPEQARHAVLEGRRVETSAPAEWMALVFNREIGHDIDSAADAKLREALAYSIDRESMNNVLLQGGGEPASTFLPNWLTGYAFLFPTAVDLQRARLARDEVQQAPLWTLGYDRSDPLAGVIAERIALNASDAGLRLQATNATGAYARLVRIPLPSLDARLALTKLAASVGLIQPRFDGSAEADPAPGDPAGSLFAAESALLQSQGVIPLLHLRNAVALGATVMGWQEDPDGSWRLQSVWLETGKP